MLPSVHFFILIFIQRGALKKINGIYYDNLSISVATPPNYNIKFYDKLIIIVAPTHLQVIMT